MGQSTEELTGEIAQTRQSLASDLDALQDRVSPSAIMERRKAAARGRVRRVRDRVMGTVHDVKGSAASGASSTAGSAHDAASTAQEKFEGAPLAAGLVAFGAGMVIASLFPAAEKETVAAAKAVDAAKEHGQPMLDEAKGRAQEVAQQTAEAAKGAAQEVKDTAGDSADRVRSEGQSAVESVRQETSA